MMSVAQIVALTFLLLLVGCSKLPPDELVGVWKIDTDKTCDAIRRADLPEEKKTKLLNYFMETRKDEIMFISADGYCWVESSDKTRIGAREKMKILETKAGSMLVELPDSGVRILGEEHEPDTLKTTVDGDMLEMHWEHIFEYNVFYIRRE